MKETLFTASRELLRRPWRALGVSAGYAMAVAVWVAVPDTVRHTRDAAGATLRDIGAHTMAFIPETVGSEQGFGPCGCLAVNGMPAKLFPARVADELRKRPSIADASPYLLLSLPAPDGAGTWTVGGFDVARPTAFAATVVAPSQCLHGRFLRVGESGRVMVEQELAQAWNLAVDAPVPLGSRTYRVCGIVKPPLRPGKANLYMTLADAQDLAGELTGRTVAGEANAVLVESGAASDHAAALADLKQALGAAAQVSSFGCSVPGLQAMGVHNRLARGIAGCVAAGMLVLVLRAQCRAVVERRRELAVLRAVGWSRRAIVAQALWVALPPAVVGALAGALGGVALSGTACCLRWPPVLAWPTASGALVSAMAFAAVGVVLGACLPALLAFRIRPAEVLRRP